MTSALENHPYINTAIEFTNAGLKLFGNNFGSRLGLSPHCYHSRNELD